MKLAGITSVRRSTESERLSAEPESTRHLHASLNVLPSTAGADRHPPADGRSQVADVIAPTPPGSAHTPFDVRRRP